MDQIKERLSRINHFAQNGIPFLFFTDYELNEINVYPLSEIPDHIKYDINGISNQKNLSAFPDDYQWKITPIDKEIYRIGFSRVMREILYGNSFLLNLTYPSKIETDLSLEQIFNHSQARYKLLIKDQFTCFSPESFIKIEEGIISSFPMKGTIDASTENAEEQILNNPKELAEHYTIVDLIRNDISQVAKKVSVDRFRYIDRIHTNGKELLQVSSKITGVLPENYLQTLGDIIFKLLPAGSICGAPKLKTLEIINESEISPRKYYTGVMGLFDGKSLDCGVMIRAISMDNDKMWYHSGGGMTHMSTLDEEYNELIDKIYVPIIRDDTDSRWRDKKSVLSSSEA